MSRNISIEEGNYGRKFSPSKLKTNLQGGGSCLWVPKDSTKLVTKRINKAGLYEAKYDEAYGYSKVTVTGIASDDDLKVIEKTVTENGSYSARNDNAAGYNVAKIKVKGGGTYTDETGKKVTPDPSTNPGSAVVGVNPDTGNEEVEKIDDDGNLKTLELASYIQLDTPPTKTSYRDGERIVMSGAVAHGYKKDGTPYKGTLAASELPWHQYGDSEDSEYSEDFLPGGIVFEMPLYADISKASRSSEKTSELDTGTFSKPIPYQEGYSYGTDRQPRSVVSNEGVCYVTSYTYSRSDETYPYGAAQVVASSQNFREKSGNNTFKAYAYTYNGKKVYYRTFRTIYKKEIPVIELKDLGIISIAQENNFKFNTTAWTMIYGEATSIGGKQTITLTWPREGDRKHLQTTFDIAVTE